MDKLHKKKPEDLVSIKEGIKPLIKPDGNRPCSFCKKTSGEVRFLLEDSNASICDECIQLAIKTLRDNGLNIDLGGKGVPQDSMDQKIPPLPQFNPQWPEHVMSSWFSAYSSLCKVAHA